MPSKRKLYAIRIPDNLLAPLQETASKYGLTFSQMMIYFCMKGIEYEKRLEQVDLTLKSGRPVHVFRSEAEPAAVRKAANDR